MEIGKIAHGSASTVSLEIKLPIQVKPSENVSEQKSEVPVLSKAEAQQAVDGLNKIMTASNSHLKFQYHEKLKEYYVSIVDETTQEVIREIPPKKLLDMVAAMWEQIGIIVDNKI